MTDPNLRQIFRPIQTGVKPDHLGVEYQEIIPSASLASYIYCYWRLKSNYHLHTNFTYRVIPDGCIDIFFNTNNIQDSRVSGLSTSYFEFDLGRSFEYVGIRFLPTFFSYLFRLDAAELTNRNESLSDVIPRIANELHNLLYDALPEDSIAKTFDQYFQRRISAQNFTIDKRLHQALTTVLNTHGSIHVQTQIDTGLSPRQLQRLFNFYVGHSPKMFSKIVRFQYFLHLLSSSGTLTPSLIYEAGYYDQPHFNKDFKSFFGLAPSQALKS